MSCCSPQNCSNYKSAGRERKVSQVVPKSYSRWASAPRRPNTLKKRHLQPCQLLTAPTPTCLQRCRGALPACSFPFAPPSERKHNSCKNKLGTPPPPPCQSIP